MRLFCYLANYEGFFKITKYVGSKFRPTKQNYFLYMLTKFRDKIFTSKELRTNIYFEWRRLFSVLTVCSRFSMLPFIVCDALFWTLSITPKSAREARARRERESGVLSKFWQLRGSGKSIMNLFLSIRNRISICLHIWLLGIILWLFH